MPFLQVLCSKVKILRRLRKIVRGHAFACPCVLEALPPLSLGQELNLALQASSRKVPLAPYAERGIIGGISCQAIIAVSVKIACNSLH